MKRLIIYMILLLLIFLLAISLGTVQISFFDIITILLNEKNDSQNAEILFNLRIPRVLNAAITGAALAVSGAVLQSLLKNPLAEPYILGISSGASFGAVLGFILGISFLVMPLAFIFSLLVVVLVYYFSKQAGELNSIKMILTGVIISSFFSAVVVFLLSINGNSVKTMFFWTMGDLGNCSTGTLLIEIFIVLVALVYLYIRHNELDLIATGDENAIYSGVNIYKYKRNFFIVSSVITSVVVSNSGIIGFVGLIIPQIVRKIIGNSHKELIIFSGILGSVFLMITDTVARILIPGREIPVGVITVLIGTPYFIYVFSKKYNL